ncbi:hypothetical protein LWI29_034698 [Acer saccharum]|uniref:F-box domain-containing protein n=1 Tax=Acer saccharum TaxID=4024 RepID=A0AA39RUW6_ACESA|nr:hypothetical protein LWI29_034698 [Acer saccharum]
MVMTGMLALPEGCIAAVIAFTTPRDACRLACVSTTFRSAADSDIVWNRFLCPEYLSKISDPGSVSSLSKKELYLCTCHNPIHNGKLCFWIDISSGKKCYMISPKGLYIQDIDDIEYDDVIAWSWWSLPDLQKFFDYIPFGRFPEVVMRSEPEDFEIRGKISTSLLSPMTTYVAYLVFSIASFVHIEDVTSYIIYSPIKVFAGLVESNNGQRRTVYFHREHQYGDDNGLFPKKWAWLLENEFNERYGWLESEFGEFFNRGDVEGELLMTVETTYKVGLIVQGIEIRPKKE